MAMTPSFTCRQCGRAFTLPPAVVTRYPGWTPPLCTDCRAKTSANGTRGGGPASRRGPVVGEAFRPPARGSGGNGPQTGVFTDGACSGNPGPGGWGVVKVVDGVAAEEACGGSPQTTNNRMELTALIEGMERLRPDE